jgi:hypothetical protein
VERGGLGWVERRLEGLGFVFMKRLIGLGLVREGCSLFDGMVG